MAYKIIRKSSMAEGFTSSNMMEILIDGESDIANLPTECTPGSFAYTADGSINYRLNLNGEWVKTVAKSTSGSGSSGTGGGSSEEDEVQIFDGGSASGI